MTVRVTINSLDHRFVASAGFSSGLDVWPWVVETLSHHLGIDESQIGCDDEDRVTIDGEPKFEIFTQYRNSRPIESFKMAAAE